MLVTMKAMLEDAQKNHYAIAAFDVSNYEMMKAVLDICEEERAPALLMGLGVDLRGKSMRLMASMVSAASDVYDIPVCFHLDHADNFEMIQSAVSAGFTSVMYDGSYLPFEENLRNTVEVVRFAHRRGVTVEAELGHVGNASVGNMADNRQNENPEDTLTDPTEVARFAGETDVDALAVAIGSAHGVYQKTPVLRIDRLDEIRAICGCPLVLHGGSGTPDEQIKRAIRHGIAKINLYSDVVSAMNHGLTNRLNRMSNPATWPAYVFEDARNAMREVIRAKIRAFGCAGRA